ncbi:MAG: UbiD family decarboxylase [Polyangiales bacterium]
MPHASLRDAIVDLERCDDLLRISDEIDPRLVAGEIQRRAYRAGGPALLFARVKGTDLPMVANLFGTLARAKYLFRDTLDAVAALVDAKVDPQDLLRRLAPLSRLPKVVRHLVPLPVPRRFAPVLARETTLSALPQLVSWPRDGGPFITLPLVYSEHPDHPGARRSNLGMYRVQIAGNDYVTDREAGLHYQIHRGIGVHHAAAIERGERLQVSVHVGGPPALTLAAIMPLPEGLPEIAFAGALGGRAVRLTHVDDGPAILADADVCIRGWIGPSETKPEGPFGDHLGYYSLRHDFPVLHVESVHRRRDAIWSFTTVGRPPQEDTTFGALIHELTAKLVPTVLPGVSQVHAVDAAGVHPLLLAIGSERYVPYARERRPMELLTQANAILGQGQMSLAKVLMIVAREDAPQLDVHDARAFLRHLLERLDPTCDLHFQVNTTVDTLDYSGTALNRGSKVILAAAGAPRRELATSLPSSLTLPDRFSAPRVCMEGVVTIQAPPFTHAESGRDAERFCHAYEPAVAWRGLPLVVLVDDSEQASRTLDDLLWTVFTRIDPARDVHGIGAFTVDKGWGCRGSIVLDARRKPHHAPPLEQDPDVVREVDRLRDRGGPLARWL